MIAVVGDQSLRNEGILTSGVGVGSCAALLFALDWISTSRGFVLSGRRPLIKGYFSALRWSWVRSCLRPFFARRIMPPALMLSAGPLPRSDALDCATKPRASGSIRFPAHHLLVTLDFYAALALGEPRPRTLPTLLTPEFADRPSCRAKSRRRCAQSCWRGLRRRA